MAVELSDWIILCVVGLNAVNDIRKREIFLWLTILFAGAGVIFDLVQGESMIFILSGLIPGGVLAGLSLISRGSVGLGDAIFLCSLGVWIGGKAAFLTVVIALVLQAAASVIYKLCGGRKKELPFLPAVAAAYLLVVLIV